MKLKITFIFLLLAVIFALFVLKGGYFEPSRAKQTSIDTKLDSEQLLKTFLSLSFLDYEGKSLTITKAELMEDIVVMHFWASWCAPCIGEVPELIQYAKKNPKVKFIIVSLDYNTKDIEKFLKSFPEFNSKNYIKLWDNNKEISNLFLVDRLPMSIIFKKDSLEPQFFKTVVPWNSIKL